MNKKLKTLLAINALLIIPGNLLGPLYALFVEGVDNRALAISVSWAVQLFAGLTTVYFVSKTRKDSSRKNVTLITIGYLLAATAWIGYVYVGNLYHLILAQIVLGIGLSIGTAPFNALFAEHLDRYKHVHEYANYQILTKLLEATSVIVGGLIFVWLGFDALFIVMAFIAFIAALLMKRLPEGYFDKKPKSA